MFFLLDPTGGSGIVTELSDFSAFKYVGRFDLFYGRCSVQDSGREVPMTATMWGALARCGLRKNIVMCLYLGATDPSERP